MNTNPYDAFISPIHSNKFSVLNLSLSSLIEGLKLTFSDNNVSYSQILTSINNEITSLTSPLSLSNPNNLSETGFIDDIIENVVLGNSTIEDDDLDDFKQNSSGISACVTIIENYNTYSLSGGDANSSIIAMHEALIAVQNTLKQIEHDPEKSLENEATVSAAITDNKEEVDLANVTFPHYEEALDVSELQTITISGVFSGGPKQNWKVTIAYLSGKIINDSYRTDSNGSINDAIFDIPLTTNIYKVTAECVDSNGIDVLTKKQSVIGESISTIVTTNMTYFYASQISNLFVTSIKDEIYLDLTRYDILKNDFETKFGIDSLPDGMNTNPYDVSTSPSASNAISVLNISLSAILAGLTSTFSGNDVSTTQLLNSLYENISDLDSSLSLSEPNNLSEKQLIDDIISTIVLANPNIDNNDLSTLQANSEGITKCVEFIETYNTYNSTGGDVNASTVALHEALSAIQDALEAGADLSDPDPNTITSELETKKSELDSDSYNFPHYTPSTTETNDIIISGFVGNGPKVYWKVTFSYLSGAIIDDSQLTNEDGRITDHSFSVISDTKIIKITAQPVDLGTNGIYSRDALTKIRSVIGKEQLSTIITIDTNVAIQSDFSISQLSSLFVASVKNEDSLSITRFNDLKYDFEQLIGISDINTNPYDTTTDTNTAMSFSYVNLSLKALVSGLESLFVAKGQPVDISEILSAVYEQISEPSSNFEIAKIYESQIFVEEIIGNIVLSNPSIDDTLVAEFQQSASGIKACVEIITDNFDPSIGRLATIIQNLHLASETIEETLKKVEEGTVDLQNEAEIENVISEQEVIVEDNNNFEFPRFFLEPEPEPEKEHPK